MSTLFLVATPIGNMRDITLRALDVLRDVRLIAAEDTRIARKLLSYHGIKTPTRAYNEHNMRRTTPALLAALDEGDVALVSDAGMPGISDPGYELVVAAVEAGHRVEPVPGASAVVASVAASGLPGARFHYLGFLPRTPAARKRLLIAAAASGDTLVAFESPHRVRAALADALAALGDRKVAVCRELTKLHEEIWRGTLAGAIERFDAPRGEFTLVIEGGAAVEAPDEDGDAGVAAAIAELRANGATSRDALAALGSRFGLSRREAYRRWHERD